ncbi:MAG: hypothetical protein PHN69_05035 [Candidatus Pacebacteria bacterium]|nr:hypothetical protein [Candidatus Paceibacterota bacterium]
MNVLMCEPSYRAKFPPLGLMKYSAWHKSKGDTVEFFKGMKPPTKDYDIIYITTLFSWDSKVTIETIKFYQENYTGKINVGGIFASLMPEYIEQQTGITPTCGYSPELDQLMPDYSLVAKNSKFDDYSYVFTTRSCPNNCKFCAVKTLDGKYWINPEWRNQVDLSRPKINIFDNNIAIAPIEHFIDVIQYTIDHNLQIRFEGGIDFRFVKPEHADWLAKANIEYEYIRLAFDDIKADGKFQDKVKMMMAHGVRNTDMSVYVLCNFTDSVEQSHYRCREIVKLGIRPISLFFIPLDHTDERKEVRMNANWTPDLIELFKQFYYRGGTWRKLCFWDWINDKNRTKYVEKDLPFSDFKPDKTSKWYRPHSEEIYMGKDSLELEKYI